MHSSAGPKAMAGAAASSTPSSALVEVPSAIEKVYDIAAGHCWQPTTQRTTRTNLEPTQAQAEETTLAQKKNP